MRNPPGAVPAATARWSDLVAELDRWSDAGRVAALWWRDDDAETATAALDRLLALAGDVPLGLAVVPAAATAALAARLERCPDIAVLQHGWRHVNHAETGKKSEFPADRPAILVTADLRAGRARLDRLFGARALPVLVPPWNRIDAGFLPVLARCGVAGLSTINPRRAPVAVADITQVNTHVDVVAWQAGRGFAGEAAVLGGIVAHLQARRLGGADAGEPTGLLTHHLVMDDATADFLARLAALVEGHAAARWAAPLALFPVRQPVHQIVAS